MKRAWFPIGVLIYLAVAMPPVRAEPLSLQIYPPQITLSSRRPVRLLIVATDAEGYTHDATGAAMVDIVSEQDLCSFRNGGLWAHQAGKGTVRVTLDGQQLAVPVEVAELGETAPPVGFHRDVMPVLTRAGCNTGTCHGSARGQDRFRLSLFGFDPTGDYHRITREQTARRINLALPDESLLLQKATGAVPHTGGKRFTADSTSYATLRTWIEEGAANHDSGEAVVDRIELFPPMVALDAVDARQPMLVIAHYADGTQRDVTRFAIFMSRDRNVVEVDEDGTLTALTEGESFITARFDKHTVGIHSRVVSRDPDFYPLVTEGNYIDQWVTEKLNQLHLPAAPLCTDEVFLRRISVDLRGRLPSQEELDDFRDDSDPDKRDAWASRFLEGDDFTTLWTQKLADLLLVRTSRFLKDKAAMRYSEWLRDTVHAGTPYDELVTELLTANGAVFDQPATGFYVAERDQLKIAENAAQVFLGIRLQCAKCHNHPFDRWTMDDYYGFAAFFAQVRPKAGEDYRNIAIFRGGGQAKHPVTGKNVTPKFLGGVEPDVKGKDRTSVAAEWIVQESEYFAPTLANRVWAHFLGRGIVEPVDDIRISNPPVNEGLYEALGEKIVEYDFDVRRLAADIVRSHAYQRATVDPEMSTEQTRRSTQNFGTAAHRRIPATTLLDCICQVTEAPSRFAGVPKGSRAVQVADEGRNYFLQTFGRSQRTSVCACGSTTEPTLSQALHLINGDTVHGKIKQGKVIERWLSADQSPSEVITAIYARSLAREPTPEELTQLVGIVEQAEQPQQALEDVFWAVLNSREFVFNH
ncbi:MAG: DUF1549 domain-containing protein [Planctomycetota bacterium]